MEELTDEMLGQEFRILWQGIPQSQRNTLGKIIREFFDKGERADSIFSSLQSRLMPERLMPEMLGYCKEHETWEDGYPFLCDCFCGLGYGGEPDNIVKKIRYGAETKKLKEGDENG